MTIDTNTVVLLTVSAVAGFFAVAYFRMKINEKFTAMYLNGASYRELADYFDGTLSGMERRRIKLNLPSPTQLREGASK